MASCAGGEGSSRGFGADASERAYARPARFAAADGLRRGAYVLADVPNGRPDVILVASGSEVDLIMAARQRLQDQKIRVRVVSMPSWELFDAQPQNYQDPVCCLQSVRDLRSKRVYRRAGIATSVTTVTCWE